MNKNDFIIPFTESVGRPIVRLKKGHTAMIDTGATVPIWTSDVEVLKSEYDAYLDAENRRCKWFGGVTKGDLYRIPLFSFGNLQFPQMPILSIENEDFLADLIIPALAFKNLRIEFDFKDDNMLVVLPPNESSVRQLLVNTNEKDSISAHLQ